MNFGRTVFSQLINFLPDREFRRCVSRYDGDRRLRSFSCWDQFLSMAFAPLTYRESLRDIEACLRSLGAKLYHMGIPRQHRALHPDRRQRVPRLAHLRRLRPSADPPRAAAGGRRRDSHFGEVGRLVGLLARFG